MKQSIPDESKMGYLDWHAMSTWLGSHGWKQVQDPQSGLWKWPKDALRAWRKSHPLRESQP